MRLNCLYLILDICVALSKAGHRQYKAAYITQQQIGKAPQKQKKITSLY